MFDDESAAKMDSNVMSRDDIKRAAQKIIEKNQGKARRKKWKYSPLHYTWASHQQSIIAIAELWNKNEIVTQSSFLQLVMFQLHFWGALADLLCICGELQSSLYSNTQFHCLWIICFDSYCYSLDIDPYA